MSTYKNNDIDSNYNKNDIKFIKNYINKICKNFNFNTINNNKYIYDKKDDYYEKCNINNLNNDISEKIIHTYNKNLVEQTSDMIQKSLSEASININSTLRKNEYLANIRNTQIMNKNIKEQRLNIYQNDNVFNEKCLNTSNFLKHAENRYSDIDNQTYIYSCGNYFSNTEDNKNKFEKCDNFGNHDNLVPSLCCLTPKFDSIINKIDNRFSLYQNAEGCSVTNNKDSVICNQKDFIFNHTNMEFVEENRCLKKN